MSKTHKLKVYHRGRTRKQIGGFGGMRKVLAALIAVITASSNSVNSGLTHNTNLSSSLVSSLHVNQKELTKMTELELSEPNRDLVSTIDGDLEENKGALTDLSEHARELINGSLTNMKDMQITSVNFLMPHNTVTTSSRAKLIGTNQHLTLDQFIAQCLPGGGCAFDIDMRKDSRGRVISYHGPAGGYTNTSKTDTRAILTTIFTAAKNNPNVLFMIRIENNNVEPEDITGLMTDTMIDRLATYPKDSIPTIGELTGKGKNVIMLLENESPGLVDEETDIYKDAPILPQRRYMLRTKWDNVKGLRSNEDISQYMQTENLDLLSKNGFLLAVDAYSTLTGANMHAVVETGDVMVDIHASVIPKIKDWIMKENKDIKFPTGAVCMYDHVTSEMYNITSVLNDTASLKDRELAEELIKKSYRLLPAVREIHRRLAKNRSIVDAFYGPIKGKRLPNLEELHVISNIAGVAYLLKTIGSFVLLELFRRTLQSDNRDTDANKLSAEIDQRIKTIKHYVPSLAVIIVNMINKKYKMIKKGITMRGRNLVSTFNARDKN